MSNFSASIPAANMQAANDFLNNTAQTPGVKSYGPNNFSVPAYAGPSPSVALLHAWGDDEFEAAVASLPNVTITQGADPVQSTKDAKNGQIIVARLGDEVTVKRFRRNKHLIELHPENPDYQTIVVEPGEPFEIEGLAVGLIRNTMLM